MSDGPTTIDLGICTYRRAHVVATLASIAALEIPFRCTLRILVADNDATPSAQVIVAEAAETYGLNITYLHAPAQNISVARNACLNAATGDYIAFIDDDEIVSPPWLSRMLTTQRDTLADVVLGPVRAVYRGDYPAWLAVGDFHSTSPVWKNHRITTGYAGNVLMKRSAPALAHLRFREDLGITGGEDTAFFQQATNAGATIAYAETALIYEAVPPDRASLRWLLRRRFRYGQTHALLMLETKKTRRRDSAIAFLKAGYCYAMAALTLLSPVHWRRWLLRGTLHLGVAKTVRRARNTAT